MTISLKEQVQQLLAETPMVEINPQPWENVDWVCYVADELQQVFSAEAEKAYQKLVEKFPYLVGRENTMAYYK